MNDREMIWTVIILAAAYYWFVVKGGGKNSRTLRGRASTGRSGTIGGGADKRPTTFANSNSRTNAHQGSRYSPAPMSGNGATGAWAGNVGGTKQGGWRSGWTTGAVGSLVSNQWPTMRVGSMGSRRIASNVTQVPSYTSVPLTVQGPGGGGSIVADA
jgi:hypothetical protein